MTRRWIFRTMALIAVVHCALGVYAAGTADSHHVNLRWLLWKHHLWPYDPDIALRYLNVDGDFRASLAGKTKAEIQQWFPVLLPKDEAILPSQKYYSKEIQTPDFFWIGDSTWAVWFEDGKLKDIEPIKG